MIQLFLFDVFKMYNSFSWIKRIWDLTLNDTISERLKLIGKLERLCTINSLLGQYRTVFRSLGFALTSMSFRRIDTVCRYFLKRANFFSCIISFWKRKAQRTEFALKGWLCPNETGCCPSLNMANPHREWIAFID